VLTYSDESFNEALKIGFGSAIRREWAWRERRGESLANLRPFAALIEADRAEADRAEADRAEADRAEADRAEADSHTDVP